MEALEGGVEGIEMSEFDKERVTFGYTRKGETELRTVTFFYDDDLELFESMIQWASRSDVELKIEKIVWPK